MNIKGNNTKTGNQENKALFPILYREQPDKQRDRNIVLFHRTTNFNWQK